MRHVLLALAPQAFLAGLSTGFFCLLTCFPIVAPLMAAENRGLKQSAGFILRLLLGRFIGYAAFGFLFGYFGQRCSSTGLKIVADFSLIVLSALLLRRLPRPGPLAADGACPAGPFFPKSALAMGFFLAMNACPPFLLSLAYVFSIGSAVQGVAYFVIFFVASSLYFIPAVFVGLLGKTAEFRQAARWGGIGSAVFFASYGFYAIIRTLVHAFR